MYQSRKTSVGKSVLVGAAIALIAVLGFRVVQDRLIVSAYAKKPLAAIAISYCNQTEAMVITGDGVVHPLPDPTDDQLVALGHVVGKDHAVGVEIPCPDASPSQQTYLHR